MSDDGERQELALSVEPRGGHFKQGAPNKEPSERMRGGLGRDSSAEAARMQHARRARRKELKDNGGLC